jgi:hypothetical protein
MKTVGKMVLTLMAMLSIATTASAVDKLVVQDSATPTPNKVFKVDETGAVTANSLAIQASGTTKTYINSRGYLGIGTNNPLAPITLNTDAALGDTNIPGGSPTYLVQGANNTERLELRSLYAPVFQGRQFNGSVSVPTATTNGKILFALGGGGHTGAAFTLNKATIIMKAAEDWSSSAQGTFISFETTNKGTNLPPSEKLRILDDGSVGIGTSSPAQKLEVNGGLRLNTATARPTNCDATTRGTIWFVQDTTNQNDSLSVCAIKGGVYGWQPLF